MGSHKEEDGGGWVLTLRSGRLHIPLFHRHPSQPYEGAGDEGDADVDALRYEREHHGQPDDGDACSDDLVGPALPHSRGHWRLVHPGGTSGGHVLGARPGGTSGGRCAGSRPWFGVPRRLPD